MGYALDRCPTVHGCCGVGLRCGVVLVAAWGLSWGALHVAAYTRPGCETLERIGLPPRVSTGMRCVHYALGVLLIAAHVMLVGAAMTRSSTFFELYVWSMVALWVLLLIAAASAAALSAHAGQPKIAGGIISTACALIFVSLYCCVVVVNYSMTMP